MLHHTLKIPNVNISAPYANENETNQKIQQLLKTTKVIQKNYGFIQLIL